MLILIATRTSLLSLLFFFNDTATTEIYTLSLQRRSSDLLGTIAERDAEIAALKARVYDVEAENTQRRQKRARKDKLKRSEEHTSELQSQSNLVCRLLLEKKKKVKS